MILNMEIDPVTATGDVFKDHLELLRWTPVEQTIEGDDRLRNIVINHITSAGACGYETNERGNTLEEEILNHYDLIDFEVF